MKRLAFIATLLLLAAPATAAERTVTLAIRNMTCGLCPITVRKAIEAVDGVMAVTVDYGTKRAAVRYDDIRVSPKRIAAASTDAGYPARPSE